MSDAQIAATSPIYPLPEVHSPISAQADASGEDISRNSVSELAFNDIALDDEAAFSPIALESRRGSVVASIEHTENDRPKSPSFDTLSNAPVKSHKKSVSTTTIRSNHRLSFMMNRLEPTEDSVLLRSSVDGQHKLQEEFARLQKERETEETVVDAPIDWGLLH